MSQITFRLLEKQENENNQHEGEKQYIESLRWWDSSDCLKRFLPNASVDTWDFWGTWGRIRRGREWAVWWVPVGTARSTRASICDVLALCTLYFSFGWRCRHGCGRTPDCLSCGVQTGCHPNCPGNPGSEQCGHKHCSSGFTACLLQVFSSKTKICLIK